ncbi:MAG: glycosyltransferase family 2 protein [Nitrospinae bacterium]|nr:glycosyltransferase family 2 protein [Nitrospinota bacterium]
MLQNKAHIGPPAGFEEDGRNFRRKPVNMGMFFSDLKPLSKEKPLRANLLDIGFGGARISTSQPLKKGMWIHPITYDDSAKGSGSASILESCWNDKAKVVWEETEHQESEKESANYRYGLEFANDPKRVLKYRFYQLLPKLMMIFIGLGIVNIVYLKWFNLFYYWYDPVVHTYSLFIGVFILSRFVLALFYSPPPDKGYLPTITTVIACKNEEDSIRKTIDCVYRSDYPKDRLEVIVVNDGSTDQTLKEMNMAKRAHPNLKVVEFEENRGKRAGMAIGAKMARGEILVYIDSDSFIQRDGLYKIVQGFVDADVGAVCGHAYVTNARKNLLTKMQEVRYFIAFRVIKAAESLFSNVTCCSGCFAAYRREYVMPILSAWLHQKFLGTQATFGDDRSLTNFMLRKYRVIYHSEAVCTTIVPENYFKFFSQQLRWKKSWIRECFLAARFMWRKHPFAALSFYGSVLFPLVGPFIILKAVFLPVLGYGPVSYLYLYGAILISFMFSLVYLVFNRKSLWIYGVSFSIFYILFLSWQTYYALLTVRKNHWGTR